MLVNTECPFCLEHNEIEVPEQGYKSWIEGELIQRALPELSASEREALMTGICDYCWENKEW
jgi:hypothetical protein